MLTRKVGETILIGEGMIEFLVTKIQGNRVTVRVTAPREIDIIRGELRGQQSESIECDIEVSEDSTLPEAVA